MGFRVVARVSPVFGSSFLIDINELLAVFGDFPDEWFSRV
jgi:hypothetical protein